MKHTIQVCVRCNFSKTLEEKEGVRGGATLFDNLAKKFVRSSVYDHFDIEKTGCMGACSQACIVAFQAPEKIGWVFGGLNPRFSVPSLIEFAEKYYADDRGMVRYAERPPELAAGLVTRMNPVKGVSKDASTASTAENTAGNTVDRKLCSCNVDESHAD